MKTHRTTNKLTIELDPGEKFSSIEQKQREFGNTNVQIWILIEKES